MPTWTSSKVKVDFWDHSWSVPIFRVRQVVNGERSFSIMDPFEKMLLQRKVIWCRISCLPGAYYHRYPITLGNLDLKWISFPPALTKWYLDDAVLCTADAVILNYLYDAEKLRYWHLILYIKVFHCNYLIFDFSIWTAIHKQHLNCWYLTAGMQR